MSPKIADDDLHAITISDPMVILPAAEYKELLIEAGYRDVPKLEKEVKSADARFRKGEAIPQEYYCNFPTPITITRPLHPVRLEESSESVDDGGFVCI